MTAKEFCRLAERLMRQPAAPYHEQGVRDEVERICREQKLAFERDKFGNLTVRLQTQSKGRPLVLAAHMDHPGFEMIRAKSQRQRSARFLGGVPDAYFYPGIRLRLLPGGSSARLGKRLGKQKVFEIVAAGELMAMPRFAVWELKDFHMRDGRIFGRACDDLIGVAAILATLIDLKRSRARVNVISVISRAEEVGFHGALTVAAHGTIPKSSLVVSLETSRELPGVKMGEGVILRVGDRASVFDSSATRFLAEVGSELSKRRKRFKFQRALMSGGTCEGTAYQESGFQTAAVCVALGNYHNCGPRNRIRAEYVSLADAMGMVELLAAAALKMSRFSKLTGRISKRLSGLLGQAEVRLAKPA